MVQWTGEAKIGHPLWWDGAEPVATKSVLPQSCDVLVIGAGYTGLSAAIAAHDAGAKVCVIDAGVPGVGASSRNGGMVGAHPRFSWDILKDRFGEAVADEIFDEASLALDWARDLISTENIVCDFQQTGRIQLAWTRAQFENQKRLVAKVKAKSRVAVELVERPRLGDEVATERYFGGMLFPEHCSLHPAKYHAGLLAAVTDRKVPVVSNCAAQEWSREAGRFTVSTAQGIVKADKIVLATNGYTPKAFRWHQRRVFPLPSYLIATEELSPNLIGELAPGRRMMVETRSRHSYFRISPDGKRLIWGGRAAMAPHPLESAAARLKATMVEVWPQLADVRLSHVWTGNTGYSFTHMPHVGEDDGLHYAMGFSGSGTVLAPYLGAKAAYQALGDARGQTGYSQTRFTTSPLHLFPKPYFLHAADFWYRNWVDRWETRKGRRP